jgi:hypothetical protein
MVRLLIRPRCPTPDVRPVSRSMFNGFLDRAKTHKWTTTAAVIAAMSGTCRKTIPTIHHATSRPFPKSPKSRSSGPRYRCSSERLAVLFDGVKALSADGCAAGWWSNLPADGCNRGTACERAVYDKDDPPRAEWRAPAPRLLAERGDQCPIKDRREALDRANSEQYCAKQCEVLTWP